MSWQGRNGIQVWVGDTFPEPDDHELAEYGYGARCGTEAGYYRHTRSTHTPPCQQCVDARREANNARQLARRRAAGMQPHPTAQPCGTDAAYYRHRRGGEQPCDACRNAHRQARAERRARSRGQQRQAVAA